MSSSCFRGRAHIGVAVTWSTHVAGLAAAAGGRSAYSCQPRRPDPFVEMSASQLVRESAVGHLHGSAKVHNCQVVESVGVERLVAASSSGDRSPHPAAFTPDSIRKRH